MVCEWWLLETAMLLWCIVLVCLSAAACQTAGPASTEIVDTLPPDTDTPVENPTAGNTWVSFSFGGIDLRLRVPSGWESDTTTDGIVLAEHIRTMESGGVLDGVQVQCFFHPISGNLAAPYTGEGNWAWKILTEILRDPHYVSPTDNVSGPIGFTWDGYDAAYYLLRSGDDTLKLVVALTVTPDLLVACNITAPPNLAAHIRSAVPAVLSSLTVNGDRLDGASLDALPDPLVFPNSPPEMTVEAP